MSTMLLMLANNTGIRVGYLAGKYPGKIGHLFSPGSQRGPFDFCKYALDNGVFALGDKWQIEPWVKMLEWAKLSGQPPLWNLVPDTVADAADTIKKWQNYSPIAKSYGWPLAFAVQDGMTALDVPKDAEVIFVGGSTEWKWATYKDWSRAFPRVHVGRVNTHRRLCDCEDAGVESIDGTGWTRGCQKQWRGLLAYLEESTGQRVRHLQGKLIEDNDDLRISRILN